MVTTNIVAKLRPNPDHLVKMIWDLKEAGAAGRDFALVCEIPAGNLEPKWTMSLPDDQGKMVNLNVDEATALAVLSKPPAKAFCSK